MSLPYDSSSLTAFNKQLIQSGYISLPQMQQALIEIRGSGRPLLEVLENITGRPLPAALLEQYKKHQRFTLKVLHGVDFIEPNGESDLERVMAAIDDGLPLNLCQRYQVLPWALEGLPGTEGRQMTLAMVDPDNLEARNTIHRLLDPRQISIHRVGIAKEDFVKIMKECECQFQSKTKPPEPSLDATLINSTELFGEEPYLSESPSSHFIQLKESVESAPVVQLVNHLLGNALEKRALELHLEPQESSLLVRYRQGNSLTSLCNPLSQKLAPALIARFKLIAGLDISQHQISQKGRIKRIYQGRTIYFMISTLPSFHGEKVVIRILDDAQPLVKLEKLVNHPATLKQVRSLVDRASGLLLVAGGNRYETAPLLYELLLSQVQRRGSLASVEDPILKILEGVTQIEVDGERGMDYETAMQALCSQAPDAILIDQLTGEKAAQQAIALALEGRMVIASLPAQSPASAIAHLRRWVDPQQLADALVGAMGQQPLRKLCPACRLADTPKLEMLSSLRLTPAQTHGATFFRANTLTEEAVAQLNLKGRVCRQCNGNGYLGHSNTFEVISITPRIKAAIVEGVDVASLLKIAQQEGMTSRLAYGIDLAMRGETTLEELKRGLSDDLQRDFATASPIASARIQETLQTLETYLLALTEEFKQLKAEFQSQVTPPTSALEPPAVVAIAEASRLRHETPNSDIDWTELEKTIDPNQATLVGDATLYEELLDPGEDWSDLKKELDSSQKTIAGELPFPGATPASSLEEEGNPFISINDPWS